MKRGAAQHETHSADAPVFRVAHDKRIRRTTETPVGWQERSTGSRAFERSSSVLPAEAVAPADVPMLCVGPVRAPAPAVVATAPAAMDSLPPSPAFGAPPEQRQHAVFHHPATMSFVPAVSQFAEWHAAPDYAARSLWRRDCAPGHGAFEARGLVTCAMHDTQMDTRE